MGLALSTSWNAFRHKSGKNLIFEIKKIGFNEVELSFNLTLPMVREISRLVADKQIKVTSLHNFCPIPQGLSRKTALPDCYSIASLNEKERKQAVGNTKKTIETARALNAKAVVLHAGRLEIKDQTRDLIRLYQRGLKNSDIFNRLKEKMIKKRKALAKPFFEKTLKSLQELNRYAAGLKVKLGIENRFYYREIPSFDEIGLILKAFKHGNIFYWHDTGHAQVSEVLGFNKHKDFLRAYAKRMAGIHLHNLSGCSDHQAPSVGDLDFKFFKPYLNNRTLKVIEAHYPASSGELKKSKILLEALFNGNK